MPAIRPTTVLVLNPASPGSHPPIAIGSSQNPIIEQTVMQNTTVQAQAAQAASSNVATGNAANNAIGNATAVHRNLPAPTMAAPAPPRAAPAALLAIQQLTASQRRARLREGAAFFATGGITLAGTGALLSTTIVKTFDVGLTSASLPEQAARYLASGAGLTITGCLLASGINMLNRLSEPEESQVEGDIEMGIRRTTNNASIPLVTLQEIVVDVEAGDDNAGADESEAAAIQNMPKAGQDRRDQT